MKVTKEIERNIIDFYTAGSNILDISKIVRVSPSTISIYLSKNNINTCRVKDKQSIIDMYNSGYSVNQISKKVKYTNPTILRILRDNGIVIRHKVDYRGQNRKKEIWNELTQIITYYTDEKKTAKEIADIYGVSSVLIYNILKENEISVRKTGDSKKIITERSIDPGVVCKLYQEGHTTDSLSVMFDVCKHVINRILKDSSIEMHGTTRLSYDTKIRNSLKHKPYTLPSGSVIYIQGYEPQFLDFIFHNKLLSEQEIVFRPPTFTYHDHNKNQRKYFPDFYIPKFNLVVEVKSSWVMNRQTPENFILKKQSVFATGYDFICILDNNFEEMKGKYFSSAFT